MTTDTVAQTIAAPPATNVALAIGASIGGTIDSDGDQDWYHVVLLSGHQYRFALRGASSASGTLTDPRLRLIGANNAVVSDNDNTGGTLDATLVYNAVQGGDFYLSAQGIGDATGTFVLSAIDLTAGPADVPGSTASQEALAIGGNRTGSVDFAGDRDWYRVTLVAGQQYRFDLHGAPSALGALADPWLELLDGNGSLITFNDDADGTRDASITYTAAQSGVHFLSAQAYTSYLGSFTLTAANLTSGQADVPGNAATGATIVVGNSATGSIDIAGDTDWFRVTLAAGQQYRFELEGAASGGGTLGDPLLRVLDANGVELAVNDDSPDGGTLDSAILFTAPASGTYFLAAQAFASGTGTYTVGTAQLAGNADVGDSTGSAAVLAAGNDVSGRIDSGGDTDWYRVSLTAGHTYRFDLSGQSSAGGTLTDPLLRLLDASGQVVLALNDDAGGSLDSSIAFTATQTGFHYLSAQAFGLATGSFTLHTGESTGGAGDVAASPGTASVLAMGSEVNGVIDEGGDQDWYRVRLSGGHDYHFSLQGAPSAHGTLPDAYLRLLDGAGNELLVNDDFSGSLDSRIDFTPAQGGTYLISAQAFASNTGSYTLSAIDETAGAGDLADNRDTTGAVPMGGSIAGTIDARGDRDWYRVSLVSGHTYRFDMQAAGAGEGTLADAFLRLVDYVDPVGNVAGYEVEYAHDDDGGAGFDASIIDYVATTTGDLFLSAQAYGDYGAGSFTLYATDTYVDVAGNAGTNTELVPGTASTGLIDTAGDQDWYQLAVTAGHRYSIDLQGSASGGGTLGDPLLRLLDAAGTVIAVDDDSGSGRNASLVYTAPQTGVIFVSAQGYGSDAGSFTLRAFDFDLVPDIADSGLTTAIVALGGSVASSIDSPGDADWFKVSLIAGRNYRFDLRGAASGEGTMNDPLLRLLDVFGAEVAANDDSNGVLDSSISYTPTFTNTFYLSAQGYTDGSSASRGTYRLHATDVTGSGDVAARFGAADYVPMGGSVTGTIDNVTDLDWYRVGLIGGHHYQFDLQGASSGQGSLNDPLLRLLDYSGTSPLATSDDAPGLGRDSRIVDFIAPGTGTFLLSAQAFQNAPTPTNTSNFGTFRLSAVDLTNGASLSTVNASMAAAGAMIGREGTVHGSIDAPGEQDWYQVLLEAGVTYRIELRGVESGVGTLVDTKLRILDGGGTLRGFDFGSGVGGESAIVFSTSTTGIYYLSAEGVSSNTGSYDLRVLVSNADVRGDLSTDATVMVGSAAKGVIDTNDDRDWYRVELQAGHDYRFDLHGAPSGHGATLPLLPDPLLRLLDAAGTEVAFDDDGSGVESRINYSPTQSAVYYLSAEAFTPNAANVGSYVLNVSDRSSTEVAANTDSTAFLPSIGGTLQGNIERAGDQDWYQVLLDAGSSYRFDLKGVPGGGGTLPNTYLRLLDSGGNLVQANDDANGTFDSSITITNVALTDRYFLSAQGLAHGTGTYTLSSTNLTAGIGSTPASAAAFVVGGTVINDIAAPGDRDWFGLTLDAGHTYRFDLRGSDAGQGTLPDPLLRLLDSNGAQLAVSDDFDGSRDSSISFTATLTDTYYLSAEAFADVSAGTYVLTATDLDGGAAPLVGGAGADTLSGGEFGDSVQGNNGNDVLDGKGGDDIVDGGAGNDTLFGGLGNDTVRGGDGDDLFAQTSVESLGDDSLSGGNGNDSFDDWYGSNSMDGGAGNDRFTVQISEVGGRNRVSGGAGQDTYLVLPRTIATTDTAWVVSDFVTGIGGDLLDVSALIEASTNARFYVAGTSLLGNFVRLQQTGTDTLVQWDRDGTEINDTWRTLLTLKNIDTAKLNANNFVGALDIGSKNDDDLTGAGGNDTLIGAGGNDVLNGSDGADLMIGGSGTDIYYVDNDKDVVRETDNIPAGGGQGSLDLGGAIDKVIASINYSLGAFVENLDLAAGNANLSGSGNELDNLLNGNAGNNTLSGLGGSDTLAGGAGADTLDGGTGTDFASFVSVRAAYQITRNQGAGGFLVAAQSGSDGSDFVRNIEVLNFADSITVLASLASNAGIVDHFDPLEYLASNPALIGVFGANTAAALNHYVNFGFNENRPINTFSAIEYLASNTGLIGVFGSNTAAALGHYVNFGYAEGRPTNTFDTQRYLASNPTLINSVGFSADAIAAHYVQSGFNQHLATTSFNGYRYLASNLGLLNFFGPDAAAATDHYLHFGFNEGRSTTAFDPYLYMASNPGLIAPLGASADAASEHFARFGIGENRPTASFSVYQYLATNSTLIPFFSGNVAAAVQHFVNFGYAENRPANGFFGQLYLASNPTLIDTVAHTLEATATHFVQTGFGQGLHVEGFNPLQYLASNLGLLNFFGPDPFAAINHYIDFGYHEGRATTSFDGLEYIASNPGLIPFFGTNADAGIAHFVYNGFTEGRATTSFNATQYAANYGDLEGKTLTDARTDFITGGFAQGRTDAVVPLSAGATSGADTLNGTSAANTLSGGPGNDTLSGGLGNDTLTGGHGNDQFVFNTALNGTNNLDRVVDFTHNADKLVLENAIFIQLTSVGALNATKFVASASGTAVDADDFVVYNTTTGQLSYDADGSGGGAAVAFALLASHPAITAADFTVI